MYKLQLTDYFKRRRNKLTSKDQQLAKKLRRTLQHLSTNPKHPSLVSHQVNTRQFGKCWSSRVTGDIRLIWNYHQDRILILILLYIGGHSGKRKVYQ